MIATAIVEANVIEERVLGGHWRWVVKQEILGWERPGGKCLSDIDPARWFVRRGNDVEKAARPKTSAKARRAAEQRGSETFGSELPIQNEKSTE